MTNWEKSCVDSLVASPTAFALFKAKQKNKKHVDQYINTIWPYEIKKVGEKIRASEVKNNDSKILAPIISFLKDLLANGEHGYVDRGYRFDREYTAVEIRNALGGIPGLIAIEGIGHIGHLVFCSHESRNISVNMSPRDNMDFIVLMEDQFKYASNESKFYSIQSDTASVREGTTDYIEKLISQLSKKTITKKEKSKFKRVYFGQNVGIEIEYDGIWQKYLEKKLNCSRHAVSFNSGIDGGSKDGSKYTKDSRLRENRLRINGHRGLNALHYLVEDMIKSKCTITNKSGMHYHIDLTHLNKRKTYPVSVDRFINIVEDARIERQLADIFEIKEDRVIVDTMYQLLRYPTEFETIEWRMGTPTFNYTKLTIQILCAIHVTNVMFKSKKTMDVEYLTYLAEIYTKINS